MNNKHLRLILITVLVACALSACKSASVDQELSKENSITPVYITIAGHIEDVPAYTQCNQYQNYRDKLLVFAAALSETGAAFNLQIEYEFFVGAARCETEELKKSTNGQNVIDYLASHYGFEIDPHQEGGVEERPDNYADIRFLGETITPAISENAGGLVWDDPQQFARLARGEQGWLYPDFTWYPKILTLAVSHAHHTGDFSRDDIACGIWSPKGAYDNFWIHDPGQQMVYVGPGEHSNWEQNSQYLSTPEFVQVLADDLERGAIEGDRMYTASIAVPQSIIFNPDQHGELLDLLDQLAPLIESGRAVYVTYSEAVDIWRTEYESQPNIFYRDGIEPARKN